MAENKNIEVGSRLHSIATGNVLAGANEIFDDEKNKKQSEINTETYTLVNEINAKLDSLSPEQQGALDVATKANKNEANLGYYVCSTEENVAAKVISDATGYILSKGGSMKVKMTNTNTAANATLNINSTGAKPLYYDSERASANNSWEAGETIEVYYDGTSYYANNVASDSSDGVFDVSKKYPTSGVEGGNTYTLEDALLVLNTNLPSNKKKGGMSIKFIQSSNNKYVQYRLMPDSFSTTPADWQGVDDIPTIGSDNLVKSGGVKDAISPLEDKIIEFSDSIQDLKDDNLYITDKNGYVVAKIDSNGIESIEITAKGKKLSEQETVTSTDIIQDLYPSNLYITDGNGNIVAKIDETGISCIGINVNGLLQNQWNKKNIATYGDSVTALNGGNYSYPYSTEATNAKWGGKVAKYFNFANIYNRGIGSTTFNYYSTHGGQVAWCRTNTGEYVDRNDSYNYDNYDGYVTIPSDCTPIRGCGSSWLRITTMFPESIKNTIDIVLVMFHNDFHQDMDTECAWVEGSNYDTEWAASEYYENYGGDYNIETVRGGIASTYMKLQAWMPQALIVLMSPISGVYVNGNDDVMDLENTESAKMKKLAETVKDIAFRLSIPFIDVYGTDCINSLNKKLRNYITDGIHPYSDAGCKVIARAIISGLHSLVPYLNY